jgi:hypothetical protein
MRDYGKIITNPPEIVQNDYDNSVGDFVFKVGDEIYGTDSIGSLKPKKYVGIFKQNWCNIFF